MTITAGDTVRDDHTIARLSALIEASGLSGAEFAASVLGRDPRSLRRYLAGDVIPPTLAAWIASVVRIDATVGRVTVVLARA